MHTKYLDPKNDLSFKKIFGTEKHKRIPIAFLNAVFNLTGDKAIKDLEFLNPQQPPEVAARKESIVDVLVEDHRGIKYIVEMQVAKIGGFEKRAQYYAAKTYCAHFGKGKKYHDLKKVVFLAITDYVVFPEKVDRYKSDHVILDNESFEHDLRDFSFTFVELPKFTKSLSELTTIEDRWYYFLKHADESQDIDEIIANHPEIKEAYEVLDRYQWSENELQYYDKLIMKEADAHGVIEAALEEGMQKGREEGLLSVARKMLSEGFTQEQIEQLTGLSGAQLKDI